MAPSIVRPGDELCGFLSFMVGGPDQRWRVEGGAEGEHIAFVPNDLRFSMYCNVIRDMRIRPPFTFFQRSVLRYLGVAPSQLHPNSWAFIKVFERLMKLLDRSPSLHVFFKLFELSRSPEKNSQGSRWSHLSLKGARFYKLFKPYSDSLKPWKHAFVWVRPICDEACRSVCELNEKGEVVAMKFPLAWTYFHYRRSPANYRTRRPLGLILRYRRSVCPKKPVDPPSTPAPSPMPVIDIDPPAGTSVAAASKRDRPQIKGKDAEVDHPHKRPKVVKEKDSSRRATSHLDLERLTDSDIDRLKADPLLFASEIARAGSRLIAKMKQGEEERAAGMLLSAKNLWLESDNLDKSDKLTRSYEYISELRQQLEAEKKKAKEAEAALQPTTEALNEARASLKSVEKERDTAVTKLSKAEEDLRLEQEKVSKLDEELGSTKKRAETAERHWHRVEDEFDSLVRSTVTLCEERFGEAIRQVRYVYPTYEINEQIINSDHTMVGGRIVIPEQKDSSGQIVRNEVVIFERPS